MMAVVAHSDCPSDLLDKVLAQFNKLQTDVLALKNWAANHQHTENTAGTYTQNAATTAPTTAPPALTSDTVSKI